MSARSSPRREPPVELVGSVSPAPRPDWDSLYAADPYALVTQSSQWTDTITAGGSWRDASVLFELAGGRQILLPLVRRTFGGHRSLHASFGEGWGMGGILAPGGPTPGDVAAVVGYLSARHAVQTTIRPNPLVAAPWATATEARDVLRLPKTAHVLDLSGGADQLFAERVSQSGRRGVRRAERSGVEVTVDSAETSIAAYYEMFLKSLERWAERSREPVWMARLRGMKRDPIDKFRTMARTLEDAMRLYLARIDGVPAAAAIVLVGANAHYTRGVMDVEVAGRTNAADLVQWAAIRDAANRGCRHYHMGETGTSASLAHFKEKFGAQPVPYAQYRIERLPLTRADVALRSAVKRVVGFRDE